MVTIAEPSSVYRNTVKVVTKSGKTFFYTFPRSTNCNILVKINNEVDVGDPIFTVEYDSNNSLQQQFETSLNPKLPQGAVVVFTILNSNGVEEVFTLENILHDKNNPDKLEMIPTNS